MKRCKVVFFAPWWALWSAFLWAQRRQWSTGEKENERFRKQQEKRWEHIPAAAEPAQDNKGWDKAVYYVKSLILALDQKQRQQQKCSYEMEGLALWTCTDLCTRLNFSERKESGLGPRRRPRSLLSLYQRRFGRRWDRAQLPLCRPTYRDPAAALHSSHHTYLCYLHSLLETFAQKTLRVCHQSREDVSARARVNLDETSANGDVVTRRCWSMLWFCWEHLGRTLRAHFDMRHLLSTSWRASRKQVRRRCKRVLFCFGCRRDRSGTRQVNLSFDSERALHVSAEPTGVHMWRTWLTDTFQ